MKKILFFIAFVTLMYGNASAQDTVWMKPAPLGDYFNNNWIDTNHRYVGGLYGPGGAIAMARQFITTDTLQIYGIAAMMSAKSSYGLPDTTREHCEEMLMLFQYHGPDSVAIMQQLGDSLPVHALYTPVSYYIMSNTPVISYLDTIRKPVYERYFQTPQVVYDTFFAGLTQREMEHIIGKEGDTIWRQWRPWFGCMCFDHTCADALFTVYHEVDAAQYQYGLNGPRKWEFEREWINCASFIFPILTPPDTTPTPVDTTVTPIDSTVTPIDSTVTPIDSTVTPIDSTVVPIDSTLGVKNVDMVGRYVSVSPNPAGDRATVLSSFGLTSIEAYDPQGRKLYSTPATGLKATLDVSAWPRGTVLLHIHTPAGTTVKKLIIR